MLRLLTLCLLALLGSPSVFAADVNVSVAVDSVSWLTAQNVYSFECPGGGFAEYCRHSFYEAPARFDAPPAADSKIWSDTFVLTRDGDSSPTDPARIRLDGFVSVWAQVFIGSTSVWVDGNQPGFGRSSSAFESRVNSSLVDSGNISVGVFGDGIELALKPFLVPYGLPFTVSYSFNVATDTSPPSFDICPPPQGFWECSLSAHGGAFAQFVVNDIVIPEGDSMTASSSTVYTIVHGNAVLPPPVSESSEWSLLAVGLAGIGAKRHRKCSIQSRRF